MTLAPQEPSVVRKPRDGVSALRPSAWDGLPPGLRRFVRAAWARRAALAAFVLIAGGATAGVAFLLPNWYSASTTILPPTEDSETFGMFSSLIESSTLSRLGLFNTSSPSDIYVEILKSRLLREALANRFGLQRLYRRPNMDATLRALAPHVRTAVNAAGVVALQVEDKDPVRAADMANFLVAQLDRFNRESINTHAKRTREFLEQRLAEVRDHMSLAESTLTAYEQRNKTLAGSEEAAVQGVANVIAERMSLQVRRAYVASYSQPDSPELREIDAQIAAYERELGRLPGLKNEGARL